MEGPLGDQEPFGDLPRWRPADELNMLGLDPTFRVPRGIQWMLFKPREFHHFGSMNDQTPFETAMKFAMKDNPSHMCQASMFAEGARIDGDCKSREGEIIRLDNELSPKVNPCSCRILKMRWNLSKFPHVPSLNVAISRSL